MTTTPDTFTPVTVADADPATVATFFNTLQTHTNDHRNAWEALQQQADDYQLNVRIHQPGTLPTDDRWCSRCLTPFADDTVVSVTSDATGWGHLICLSCIEELPDWDVQAVREHNLMLPDAVDDIEAYDDIYALHRAYCGVDHDQQ